MELFPKFCSSDPKFYHIMVLTRSRDDHETTGDTRSPVILGGFHGIRHLHQLNIDPGGIVFS